MDAALLISPEPKEKNEPRTVASRSPYAVRPVVHSLLEYALTAAVTVVLMFFAFELWHCDLTVPFSYDGDGLLMQFAVQTLVQDGWYLHNAQVGAPFAMELNDFAIGGSLHFFLIKCIAFFTHDAGIILNVYFLLVIPLTALTSLFVFRHFGCSYPASLVGSVLYAFLPRYIAGGPGGILLSPFVVPPMVMVILWLCQDPTFLFERRHGKMRFHWFGGKTWACVLAGTMIASSFIYLAFFACFLLLVSGVSMAISHRTLLPLKSAGFVIAVIAAMSVANLAPAFLYARSHGPNTDASRRNMGEAEPFSLRVAQLLMPISDHRVPFLAYAKARFNAKLAKVTENDLAALGLAGSFGFLLLIGRLLVRRPSHPREGIHPAERDGYVAKARDQTASLLESLSVCNVFAVLLATMGSFGLLVAAALPHIRCYNRMSIYIGFFSLFALVLTLDWLARQAVTRLRKIMYYGLLGALLVGGVLDQTPRTWAGYAPSPAFHADAEFVGQVEAALPEGAMVYQLPYYPFPEGGDRYTQLRCYLHSSKLRWSYPTMRGRDGDLWNRSVTEKPLEDLVPSVIFAGFQGIVVDRQDEQGPAIEAKLESILGRKADIHGKGPFVFFDLTSLAGKMRQQYTASRWEERREQALHPVTSAWRKGFNRDLTAKEGRWCAAQGEISLHNPSERPRQVTMTVSLRSGRGDPAHARVISPWFTRELEIDAKTGDFVETFTVPPGRHAIVFSCDGRSFGDDPKRIFKIMEYRVR